MINIKSIETADSKVIRTIKSDNAIQILLSSVYDLNSKKYVNNILLKFNNWSDFIATIYVSKDVFESVEEKKLEADDVESFEIIQRINSDGRNIILEGFSKNSNQWMKYEFINCTYKIFFI